MKPAPFEYHAPTELAAVVNLLAELGDGARLLSGGQSLLPLLNMRLARPTDLVDLNGVSSLHYHRVDSDGLVVGALCRHRDVELDPRAAERFPAVGDAVPLIGHVGIRNRGTVVGSLAHADPAAEWPALALLLDASIRVATTTGERTIPAREFFTGLFSTALRDGEVVIEARFPNLPERAGSAFVELARRHGDFALGAAGAVVKLAADGTVEEARLCFAGFHSVPVRANAAEESLAGKLPRDAEFAAAAALAASALNPTSDVHTSAAYRRSLAVVLARRALRLAATRAGVGPS